MCPANVRSASALHERQRRDDDERDAGDPRTPAGAVDGCGSRSHASP